MLLLLLLLLLLSLLLLLLLSKYCGSAKFISVCLSVYPSACLSVCLFLTHGRCGSINLSSPLQMKRPAILVELSIFYYYQFSPFGFGLVPSFVVLKDYQVTTEGQQQNSIKYYYKANRDSQSYRTANRVGKTIINMESANANTIDASLLLGTVECPLCLNMLCEPISISCGHTFCRVCLATSLRLSKKKCPSCREVNCDLDSPVTLTLTLTKSGLSLYRYATQLQSMHRRILSSRIY